MGRENPCARLTVGLLDCQHQITTGKCPGLLDKPCPGKTTGVGHDVPTAKRLVAEKKQSLAAEQLATEQIKTVAVDRLIKYRSTEEGLGHLSNRRAVHSSPVPFGHMKVA